MMLSDIMTNEKYEMIKLEYIRIRKHWGESGQKKI